MKIILYLYYFLRSVFLRGFFGTLRLLIAEPLFEKKLGIRTAQLKKSKSSEFFHYQGAAYLPLFRIFSSIAEETRCLHFVDIGCGKGRAVFAAEFSGWNNLTGVELDETLVKDAEENLMRYLLKRKESCIQFVHENALNYNYRDLPTVYFLFNPFNEQILRQVLDRICSRSNAETWFIYMNPRYPAPFNQKGIPCVKEIKTLFYSEALIFKKEGSALH